MKKQSYNQKSHSSNKKILNEEQRVSKILGQFERKRETYLGDRTLAASIDTQQHNAAVCRKFLEFAARHFKKVSELKHITQDHYAHWIQVRRREGISGETRRKDAYILDTFFKAAGLDIHVNPQRQLD